MSKKPKGKIEYVTIGGLKYPLPTPEEDRKIHRAALSDPDNPPLKPGEIAAMKPWHGRRGPQKAPTKVQTTIRLSPEVVRHFKARGRGWQSEIDAVLKAHVAKAKKPRASAKRASP